MTSVKIRRSNLCNFLTRSNRHSPRDWKYDSCVPLEISNNRKQNPRNDISIMPVSIIIESFLINWSNRENFLTRSRKVSRARHDENRFSPVIPFRSTFLRLHLNVRDLYNYSGTMFEPHVTARDCSWFYSQTQIRIYFEESLINNFQRLFQFARFFHRSVLIPFANLATSLLFSFSRQESWEGNNIFFALLVFPTAFKILATQ